MLGILQEIPTLVIVVSSQHFSMGGVILHNHLSLTVQSYAYTVTPQLGIQGER